MVLQTGWKHWDKYLNGFVGKNINVLQIGVYKGDASLWFLKNILTSSTSKLYSIDTFEGSDEYIQNQKENLFTTYKNNIRKFKDKVIIYKDISFKTLINLNQDNVKFDIIYIDASHFSKDVISDAILSWNLLKINGILIFDDYIWKLMKPNIYTPAPAIDSFLEIYKYELYILHKKRQVIIRKTEIKKLPYISLHNIMNNRNLLKLNENFIIKKELLTKRNKKNKIKIIQSNTKPKKLFKTNYKKLRQIRDRYNHNENVNIYNPLYLILPNTTNNHKRFYENLNIKKNKIIKSNIFIDMIIHSSVHFYPIEMIARFHNSNDKNQIILNQNFTPLRYEQMEKLIYLLTDKIKIKYINLMTIQNKNDIFPVNFDDVKNINYNNLIDLNLITKLKKHFTQKLDMIILGKNYYDEDNTIHCIKQYILNLIFCITFQKDNGSCILYLKNDIDKPLLDFIYLCNTFYNKITITNSYTANLSNILVCENFDISKKKYLNILKYLYDNIDSSKYIHQIFDLNHEIKIFKKYDDMKYKKLSNYYDLLDKFYCLLQNEDDKNKKKIKKFIIPIQIYNLIKWIKLNKK